MKQEKLILVKALEEPHATKRGMTQDRICTHDAGLVFRNKKQWRKDKSKRANKSWFSFSTD